VAATSGSVARPLTTSTSAVTGAGLKKCMPATRPGWRKQAHPVARLRGDLRNAGTHRSGPDHRDHRRRWERTVHQTAAAAA